MKPMLKNLMPPSVRPLALGASLAVLAGPSVGFAGSPGASGAIGVTSADPSSAASADPTVLSWYGADLSPGEASTNAISELEEIYAPREGLLNSWRVWDPLDLISNPLNELYQNTGFRIGFASTSLFMQPLGSQSSSSGASGDLDLMTSWTAIGRGTENTGTLVATAEHRYTIGGQPASAVGGQMGTLLNTTGAFNDRGEVIRDLYWIQRFFDGRLRVLIGRAAPDDYVGAHRLQNTNNSFVNRHFSANPAVPWPGHGPLLGVSVQPTDLFYLTAGAANAYGDTTRSEISSLFDEWDLFSFVEAGFTPTIEGMGTGRYAFGIWHMDARGLSGLPSDDGFTLIADQPLTDKLQVFARYSYSDAVLTNIRQLGQVGLGLSGLTGSDTDLTGLAVSHGIPRSDASREETVVEAFHRLQVSRHAQLSVGFQLIANPGNAIEDDTAGAFYVRLRTSF